MFRGMLVVIITAMTLMNSLYAMEASEGRRSKALRLYQEGLFQEMGTGNLELAFTIYNDLAKTYVDIHDIAAVANYHMGMIMDKKGEAKKARRYFTIILEKYADQSHVVKRVEIKLQEPPYIGNQKIKNMSEVKKAVGPLSELDDLISRTTKQEKEDTSGVPPLGYRASYLGCSLPL